MYIIYDIYTITSNSSYIDETVIDLDPESDHFSHPNSPQKRITTFVDSPLEPREHYHTISQIRDNFDDPTWDHQAKSEFKSVLQGIYENLPKLNMRYDVNPQVKTCAELDSDNLNLQHPVPAFSETVLIPSSFRRIESVLLNTDKKHKFTNVYDIPAGARSNNNFSNKRMGHYRKKNYSHYNDKFLPEPPQSGPVLDKYSGVDSKSSNITVQSLIDIEQQPRRSLPAVSAVDTLTGGIRRLNSKDPISDFDIETRDAMCKSLVKSNSTCRYLPI